MLSLVIELIYSNQGEPFSGSPFLTNPIYEKNNLPPGNYTIFVSRDANNCGTNEIPFTIENNPNSGGPIEIILDDIQHPCISSNKEGEIHISVEGGVSPYTYVWKWSNSGEIISHEEDLSTYNSGSPKITITDAAGCSISKTFQFCNCYKPIQAFIKPFWDDPL